MNKKEKALAALRVAGYHEDKRTFTRVYIENRINLQTATAEYNKGIDNKRNGMICTCEQCKAK
jgi:hypothetical protein